jgi:hypothetical protein
MSEDACGPGGKEPAADGVAMKTMGMVLVACLAARAAGVIA